MMIQPTSQRVKEIALELSLTASHQQPPINYHLGMSHSDLVLEFVEPHNGMNDSGTSAI